MTTGRINQVTTFLFRLETNSVRTRDQIESLLSLSLSKLTSIRYFKCRCLRDGSFFSLWVKCGFFKREKYMHPYNKETIHTPIIRRELLLFLSL
jgi:hypothetical protein